MAEEIYDVSIHANFLRAKESQAELNKELSLAQLELIYQEKWFKMYVPKALGGLELDLLQAMKLQENLAYEDGSLAWTVTLCAGAVYFIGFIDPTLHEEWFKNKQTCWGGSGMCSGTAQMNGNSFIINGQWKFATGAPHNTVFTANCYLLDEEKKTILNLQGEPDFASFFFKAEEVSIQKDWDTMGLCSTASHSFEVKEKRIPSDRMFRIDPNHSTMTDTKLFHYPFMVFAQCTLAANYMGMFRSFFDELLRVLTEKGKLIPSELSEAIQSLHLGKNQLLQLVVLAEEDLAKGKALSDERTEHIEKIASKLVHDGFRSITDCFPYAGMNAVQMQSRLNRIWRNLFTASQHSIFRKP